MANNAISRTGTYTDSANTKQTYHYKPFTAAEITAGSAGISGTDYYSNDDFDNGSIFTDIDDKISVTFSQKVDKDSVKTFNKDTELSVALQNQEGTIGLTHVVTGVTGETTDGNNLQALKLTSLPNETYSEIALQEFVEMSSLAATGDDQTYVFTPKANLSSNTTYFLKIDTDNLLDVSGTKISYSTERGFVTDNTKTFVTTNDYYEGFSMQIENADLVGEEVSPDLDDDSHPKFESGDTMSLSSTDGRAAGATVLKIQSIDGTKLTYQLEPASYSMNVSYTATSPIVITNTTHNLIDDDKIEVYDIVSGEGITTGEYTVTKITADTFSIPVDGTGSDAGALNYYRNVNKNDFLVWSEILTYEDRSNPTTYTIRKKALSTPHKMSKSGLSSELFNNTFSTIKDSTTVAPVNRRGKLINSNYSIISYVPIDVNDKLTTDTFVNNSIVDVSTSTNDIRFHIKANTSPNHNVHPFHSSAPKVTSTLPEDGSSIARKLKITQITRKDSIALVSTNHPHNLSIGSLIKIIGSTQDVYNKTISVSLVPSSNTFQYDLGSSNDFTNTQSPAPGNPKLQISYDSGVTYEERYNAMFVNFSQSMNTSTIIVANSTHLISANGSTGDFVTSTSFAYGQDSASSTIQISDSGFVYLLNCVSVTASAGNSVFAIVPEILEARHRYKIKATKDIQDLGKTNSIYEFATTKGITTGVSVIDPLTGQETVFSKDEEPPEIRKISFTSAGTDGVAGMVLESNTASEITSPDDYQAVDIDLDDESILVQFSEAMNIDTVTTATTSTVPTGTIQLSSDDYDTVVQMSGAPVVTSTDNENDTFKFTPIGNLSANAIYTLKVAKGASDASPEQNQMLTINASSAKVLTVNALPASVTNYYVPGETISGVRTLQISANTGTPAIGLTAGDTFLGLTSKGKGKVLDFTEDSGAIETLRYTELAGEDGTIIPLTPGEVCKVFAGPDFTIDRYGITSPPEGNVISFTSGTKKLIYRDNNPDNEFVSGSVSSDRIVGRTSNGYSFAHESTGIVGPGLKTATTAILANVFFSKDSALVSPNEGNQIGINENSNLTVTFNQTMNVESIDFNSADSLVRTSYNVLLSYDSNFQNTIPLSPTFSSSNNDTIFEFQPAILSNTNLQLTQDMKLYARVTDTAKNKGDMNLASNMTSTYYANTVTDVDFEAINASVFTQDGQEIQLGVGTSVSMPNQSSKIDKATPIIIQFNEVPDLSSFALDSEIQIGTASNFLTDTFFPMPADSLVTCGTYGTQIKIQLGVNRYGLTTFSGSGLNDATYSGVYEGDSGGDIYRVQIHLTPGGADVFLWQAKAVPDTNWVEQVSITGGVQYLGDGISIKFDSTTGHTIGDYWDITTNDNSTRLDASTQYYVRVGATVGGTNEGGKALKTAITYLNSFTTA